MKSHATRWAEGDDSGLAAWGIGLRPVTGGSFGSRQTATHPPEYVGREVWARWDGHLVRVFNFKMEQIALHVQGQPGQFQTNSCHIDSRKISNIAQPYIPGLKFY
jgi:hypothetical protein